MEEELIHFKDSVIITSYDVTEIMNTLWEVWYSGWLSFACYLYVQRASLMEFYYNIHSDIYLKTATLNTFLNT